MALLTTLALLTLLPALLIALLITCPAPTRARLLAACQRLHLLPHVLDLVEGFLRTLALIATLRADGRSLSCVL